MTVAQAQQRTLPFPFELPDLARRKQQEFTGLPDHDEIERCAYAIHIDNGRVAGRQEQDWLQAERQLRRELDFLPPPPGAPRVCVSSGTDQIDSARASKLR